MNVSKMNIELPENVTQLLEVVLEVVGGLGRVKESGCVRHWTSVHLHAHAALKFQTIRLHQYIWRFQQLVIDHFFKI
jgi:hypothetical protein